MSNAVSDTSPEIAMLQRQHLSSLTVAERAELLDALCQDVTEASIAGFKLQNPDATEAQIRSHLLLARYGPEFVASLPPSIR